MSSWAQWAGAHQFLIKINPIEITLVRYTRERQQRLGANGPGYLPWQPEELGPFVVRIHQQGGGSTNTSEVTVGHQERDSTWGMIMGPEVPLRVTDGEDDSVRIMFVHPAHGSFRLRRVRALETVGKLLGWQSDLERVSHTGPVPEPFDVASTSGRKRLEDDPDHPWRDIVEQAEALRAAGPRLSWDMIAARLGVTGERLGEYRRRARLEDERAENEGGLATPQPAKVRTHG